MGGILKDFRTGIRYAEKNSRIFFSASDVFRLLGLKGYSEAFWSYIYSAWDIHFVLYQEAHEVYMPYEWFICYVPPEATNKWENVGSRMAEIAGSMPIPIQPSREALERILWLDKEVASYSPPPNRPSVKRPWGTDTRHFTQKGSEGVRELNPRVAYRLHTSGWCYIHGYRIPGSRIDFLAIHRETGKVVAIRCENYTGRYGIQRVTQWRQTLRMSHISKVIAYWDDILFHYTAYSGPVDANLARHAEVHGTEAAKQLIERDRAAWAQYETAAREALTPFLSIEGINLKPVSRDTPMLSRGSTLDEFQFWYTYWYGKSLSYDK